MGNALRTEYQTYKARKPELLPGALGKWVLIKGDQVLGMFETRHEALRAGYRRYLDESFLVQQVLEVDPVYHFVWLRPEDFA